MFHYSHQLKVGSLNIPREFLGIFFPPNENSQVSVFLLRTRKSWGSGKSRVGCVPKSQWIGVFIRRNGKPIFLNSSWICLVERVSSHLGKCLRIIGYEAWGVLYTSFTLAFRTGILMEDFNWSILWFKSFWLAVKEPKVNKARFCTVSSPLRAKCKKGGMFIFIKTLFLWCPLMTVKFALKMWKKLFLFSET